MNDARWAARPVRRVDLDNAVCMLLQLSVRELSVHNLVEYFLAQHNVPGQLNSTK